MERLAGKVAFITGAGTGIGRATACCSRAEGARVVRRRDRCRGPATRRRTSPATTRSRSTPTSTDPTASSTAIRRVRHHFGGAARLHNNAGGSTPQDNTVVEAPIEEFWRAITLDLFGTFLGCRFGIPAIIESGGGSVINMTLERGADGHRRPRLLHRGEGRHRRDHPLAGGGVAPQRVRVNAIAPSATMTERVKRLVAGNPALTELADSHLLGLIEPEDIANCALYLASDESRMVTGQVLPVDSGVTIS